MERNLDKLHERDFDLLVIGGGITGAWVALDATLRGLSTAMVDKGDFGAATSAATGRMIHGGIRYLQHLALGRVKESLHERMLLLRNAPHLVHPVPFLIPTFGHALKGKEVLSMAMILYDFFANRAVPGAPYAAIPSHQRLSREEAIRMEPHLPRNGLTGAVRFYDCQMPFPERLTLAVIQSAEKAGATVANYAKVTGLAQEGQTVVGAHVQDQLTDRQIVVRAACTVNAAGPWASGLLRGHLEASAGPSVTRQFSKGIHIITRALTSGNALALATRHQHSGSWLGRGGRHFFIIPWEGHSLVGTTNAPFDGHPDEPMVTEDDIRGLIADVNSVYPEARLARDDVRHFYGGLYPDDPGRSGTGYQGGREDRIVDHSQAQGLEGLVSVIGVKYTTARKLAEAVVNTVSTKFDRSIGPCSTDSTVLHGGDMPGLEGFLLEQKAALDAIFPPETVARLVRLYGTKIPELLDDGAEQGGTAVQPARDRLAASQTRYAVRQEMACRLTDVLFRRTSLGLFGHPGKETLRGVAGIMAQELGWDAERIEEEISCAENHYRVTAG
jgi:glycerol-3-phosphate dehydrogenase